VEKGGFHFLRSGAERGREALLPSERARSGNIVREPTALGKRAVGPEEEEKEGHVSLPSCAMTKGRDGPSSAGRKKREMSFR